jgi:hypothetical protein
MEIVVKITLVFFPLLTIAAGAAFAQEPPLTGLLKAGALSMVRASSKISAGPLGTIESTTDAFAASFSVTDLSKIVRTEQAPVTTIGSCFITPLGLQLETPPRTDAVTYLDAGPFINITGPAGTKQLPKIVGRDQTLIGYGGELGGGLPIPFLPPPPPLFVTPGTYTADNGAGGPDVGAFTATLNIGTLFSWTNPDAALSIDRAAGIDVTWTGGDPEAKVFIGGAVTALNTATRRVEGGATFTCLADNSAGHFVVSPEVLTLLPASTTTAGVSNGTFTVNHVVTAKFDAPGVGESQFSFATGEFRASEYK